MSTGLASLTGVSEVTCCPGSFTSVECTMPSNPVTLVCVMSLIHGSSAVTGSATGSPGLVTVTRCHSKAQEYTVCRCYKLLSHCYVGFMWGWYVVHTGMSYAVCLGLVMAETLEGMPSAVCGGSCEGTDGDEVIAASACCGFGEF